MIWIATWKLIKLVVLVKYTAWIFNAISSRLTFYAIFMSVRQMSRCKRDQFAALTSHSPGSNQAHYLQSWLFDKQMFNLQRTALLTALPPKRLSQSHFTSWKIKETVKSTENSFPLRINLISFLISVHCSLCTAQARQTCRKSLFSISLSVNFIRHTARCQLD